jgi:hypothetical protein
MHYFSWIESLVVLKIISSRLIKDKDYLMAVKFTFFIKKYTF